MMASIPEGINTNDIETINSIIIDRILSLQAWENEYKLHLKKICEKLLNMGYYDAHKFSKREENMDNVKDLLVKINKFVEHSPQEELSQIINHCKSIEQDESVSDHCLQILHICEGLQSRIPTIEEVKEVKELINKQLLQNQ